MLILNLTKREHSIFQKDKYWRMVRGFPPCTSSGWDLKPDVCYGMFHYSNDRNWQMSYIYPTPEQRFNLKSCLSEEESDISKPPSNICFVDLLSTTFWGTRVLISECGNHGMWKGWRTYLDGSWLNRKSTGHLQPLRLRSRNIRCTMKWGHRYVVLKGTVSTEMEPWLKLHFHVIL